MSRARRRKEAKQTHGGVIKRNDKTQPHRTAAWKRGEARERTCKRATRRRWRDATQSSKKQSASAGASSARSSASSSGRQPGKSDNKVSVGAAPPFAKHGLRVLYAAQGCPEAGGAQRKGR